MSGPGQAALTEFELRVKAEAQVRELERELASTNDAALLLHKRVEELERERDKARQDAQEDRRVGSAQLAERDKRIEGLHNGCEQALLLLERKRFEDDPEAKIVRAVLRAALADPVVVPGWDDGTWNQKC